MLTRCGPRTLRASHAPAISESVGITVSFQRGTWGRLRASAYPGILLPAVESPLSHWSPQSWHHILTYRGLWSWFCFWPAICLIFLKLSVSLPQIFILEILNHMKRKIMSYRETDQRDVPPAPSSPSGGDGASVTMHQTNRTFFFTQSVVSGWDIDHLLPRWRIVL